VLYFYKKKRKEKKVQKYYYYNENHDFILLNFQCLSSLAETQTFASPPIRAPSKTTTAAATAATTAAAIFGREKILQSPQKKEFFGIKVLRIK